MDFIELLHNEVWNRFVKMPEGYILDYVDKNGDISLPTAEECKKSMPNALGWWTPIENGAFFTGLYVYALIKKYNVKPDEKTGKEIEILINGLKLLQDVSTVDGFVARGVAGDDGVSHYPISSEDQVVPWALAMNAYLKCSLCSDKQDIEERLLRLLMGIKNNEWRVPSEIENITAGNWGNARNWRGICKLLYCSRLIYELTGKQEDLEHYKELRDSYPKDCYFDRKEMVSHSFSADMIANTNLIQPWIFVASHMALRELSVLDEEATQYYNMATKINGVICNGLIDKMKKYDNKPDGFDPDWRRMEFLYEPPKGTLSEIMEQGYVLARFWSKEVFPHRGMEHGVLGGGIFAAWMAVTCGDKRVENGAAKKFIENCEIIKWEDLHISYAFAAESVLIFSEINIEEKN